MFQANGNRRRIGDIIGLIVILILAFLIVCTFVVYGIFRDSNTAPSVFGHRIYLMNGDGMEPRIKKGSAVFIEEGALPSNEGNVILCDIEGRLAVVGFLGCNDVILPDGSVETRYVVKYDNTPADQTWTVGEKNIIGRAKSYDTTLGAVIRFASSKNGMLIVVIIPCALLVIYEIAMLVLSMRNRKSADDLELEEVENMEIAPQSAPKPLDFGNFNKAPAAEPAKKVDLPEFNFGMSEGNKPEPKAEPKPEIKPEPKIEARPEPKPEPKPEVRPEPKPETDIEKGLDQAAKAIASDANVDQTMARIDELIKLLEEEKAKLSGK